MNQEKIDCFLLAAGEASRMFPLNHIMEKSLLPVDGVPVIRRIAVKMMEQGVVNRMFICCLDKFKKQFQHEFRDLFNVQIIGFEKPMGTFHTFFGACDSKHTEWSLIHYADCLTNIDYNEFISNIDDNWDGLIAVTNTVKHDYSEVLIDRLDNTVGEFVEKPFIRNYVWSGIGLFRTENIRKYYNGGIIPQDFARDIFPEMVKKNKLKAYLYHGEWFDVGNLNAYRKVCESFKS